MYKNQQEREREREGERERSYSKTSKRFPALRDSRPKAARVTPFAREAERVRLSCPAPWCGEGEGKVLEDKEEEVQMGIKLRAMEELVVRKR